MENKNMNTTNGSVLANEKGENRMMNGELTYEDKVIQKIIGYALKDVDGLLTLDGGFFSNMAEKLVNTDNVTAGINTEVGKKQVAVDLDVIVEYGKDIEDIYNQIKELISTEVNNMTHLDVIEDIAKSCNISKCECCRHQNTRRIPKRSRNSTRQSNRSSKINRTICFTPNR